MDISDILDFFGISLGSKKNDDIDNDYDDNYYYEYEDVVVKVTANNGLDGGDVIETPYYLEDD